jgi:predicted dehydrogenase
MKTIKAVLVGAGNRGCVYSDYSLIKPEELQLVAVVDHKELARKEACERYKIPDNMAFSSLD